MAMLRHAERSIEPEIAKIENLGERSVSQTIQRAQLTNARAAIHAEIDHHMAMVGDEVRGRRTEAAEAAGRALAETAVIFKTAGLSDSAVRNIQRSMICLLYTSDAADE